MNEAAGSMEGFLRTAPFVNDEAGREVNPNTVAKLAVSVSTYSIDKPYDYLIPQSMLERAEPGKRVIVPFGRGNRRCEGLILSLCADDGSMPLKAIESISDDEPVLDTEQLKLAMWMHERFFCTVYEAARAMLPAGMWLKDGERRIGDKTVTMARLAVPAEDAEAIATQKKLRAPQQSEILSLLARIGETQVNELLRFTGASATSLKALVRQELVVTSLREVLRRPDIIADEDAAPIVLNRSQQEAYDRLSELLRSYNAGAALLYGVTGSGKTSVYIRLIEETIRLGRTAITLVPEIALTPQLMSVFAAYFGSSVAVLHSALGVGERYDEWKRIRAGDVKVVVGTRSAIFAPLKNLGLIILDEEQESTYKSENSPRYHARDIAKYRCAHSGALLLLGSATPAVESMYSALAGKYSLLRLATRYNNSEMPPVIISDMKKELSGGEDSMIGSALHAELKKNIEAGEQSILFINRRGTNTLVACGECGYTFTCPRCSVSMTYHATAGRLMCHYCGHSQALPSDCPECGGKLKFIGAGTQKIETELGELFPGVGVIRMDADTVSQSHPHEEFLTRFRRERTPILLGTQMVTKGLDFENVTLVGVLSADQLLYINDFRAHERTFSLITQVVGRSGRGSKPGRAVIQTYTPENEVIKMASLQDYDSFYEREIELRRISGTPPIFDLFTITASGIEEARVLAGCVKLKSALRGYLAGVENIMILGPAPASVTKVNNRFRYRVSLSCQSSKLIRDTIAHIIREFSRDSKFKGVAVYADMNSYE